MKVLKWIGIIVLVLILIIIVLALIAPRHYEVERTVLIDAPQEVVFMHVQYWSAWKDWSPWAEQDTAMVVSIEGEDGLKGSKYLWTGSPKITGQGELENTGVKPNESIDYHQHFIKPMESHSDGYVRLSDVEGKTQVAWGMYGDMGFIWNIMLLFQPMDKMVDKDFTRGLELLKGVVDEEMAAIKAFPIEKTLLSPISYVVIRKQATFGELSTFMGEAFGQLMGQLAQAGKQPAGPPACLYYAWDMATASTDIAAAVPFTGKAPEGMEVVRLPSQSVYQGDYFGPYDKSGIAHWAFDFYLKDHGLEANPPMIETYFNSPMDEPDPAKLHTRITYLVK